MQLNQAIERALRATEHSGRWHCVFRPDMLELRYIVARQDDLWAVRGTLVASNAWARPERMTLALEDFTATDWQMEMCDEGIQSRTRDCLLFTGHETMVKDSATGRTALIPIMPDLQRGRAALANQQR